MTRCSKAVGQGPGQENPQENKNLAIIMIDVIFSTILVSLFSSILLLLHSEAYCTQMEYGLLQMCDSMPNVEYCNVQCTMKYVYCNVIHKVLIKIMA